jgi:hypothetical protein
MPPAAQLQAMKQLDWLVGRWKGEAVIEYQPGQRRTINQTETVQSKLSGLVLLVEGVGTIRTPGEEREIPVFEALAVVSYDDQAKRYRWQAFTGGQYQDAEAKVTDGGIEWRLANTPMGSVRYTIRRTPAGEWHEIGESSTDATNWRRFFEMTLRRAR